VIIPSRIRLPLLALVALACGGKHPVPEPVPGSAPPKEAIRPFLSAPFAGQQIAVIPLTLVVALDTLNRVPLLSNRVATLAWADSIVGESFMARSPEVKWALPAELRKIARRAPTVAPDPDRMGQSLMRQQSLDEVPDPLRGNLRSLMAMLNGRFAMIPAAVTFVPESPGVVRAEVSLVLADTRTGKVVWRTITWGLGATPTQALAAAMDTVLPV
jgi:hypothetical protein